MANEFKQTLEGKEKVFGIPLKTSRLAKMGKTISEGIRTSWQRTSIKRTALVATAAVILAVSSYNIACKNAKRGVEISGAALQQCKAERQKTISDVALKNVERERLEKERKVKEITRTSEYANAVISVEAQRLEELNRSTTDSMNLDCAYYLSKTESGTELFKVDFTKADNDGRVWMSIKDIRKYLDRGQNAELDRILAALVNGSARSKILEYAGNRSIAEVVEGLGIGNSNDTSFLHCYLYNEIVNGKYRKTYRGIYERFRKFLLDIRPAQAKAMKEGFEKSYTKWKSDVKEKNRQERKGVAKWASIVLSVLGGLFIGGGVASESSKKKEKLANGAFTGAIIGTLAGCAASLVAWSLVGFWGIPAGVVAGLVGGIISCLDN